MIKNMGLRIMMKRKMKGITQEKLANELGISKATLVKWEKDGTDKLSNIEILSNYFNVPGSYFLNEEE